MLLEQPALAAAGQEFLPASSRDIQADAPFCWLSQSIVRGMKLPRCARAVLLGLASYANAYSQECFPKVSTLAEQIDYSVRQTQRGLAILIERGLIERRLKRGGPRNNVNLYRLLSPPDPESSQPAQADAAPTPEPLEPAQEARATEEQEDGPIMPTGMAEAPSEEAFEEDFFQDDALEDTEAASDSENKTGSDHFFWDTAMTDVSHPSQSSPYTTEKDNTEVKDPLPPLGTGGSGETPKKRLSLVVIREATKELAEVWGDQGLHHSPRDNQGYGSKKALRAVSRALRGRGFDSEGFSLDSLKESIRRYRKHLRLGKNGLKFARTFANFWASRDFLAHLPRIVRQPTEEELRIRRTLKEGFGWMNGDEAFLEDVFIQEGEDGVRFIVAVEDKAREKLARWLAVVPRAMIPLLEYAWEDQQAESYRAFFLANPDIL